MSAEKINAAKKALEYIKDNMTVAIGSGTTAYEFIKLLAERVKDGLNVICTSTSFDSTILARKMGIKVQSFDSLDKIDIAIDGADVASNTGLLKGGGGACTIEKLIDYSAEKFLVIVDEKKVKDKLIGTVVIEVLPIAYKSVMKNFKNPVLRVAKKKLGPVITDNGNFLLDVNMTVEDPEKMEKDINNIPGVVENGIFTKFDDIIVGTKDSAAIL
ncbi:MAG: ribose-5-phosphate isomerase RpiA [Spirochaetota bacterium]